MTDQGEITDKNELPVKQLRFGDTGTPLDDKQSNYRLGPLMCEGDSKFINFYLDKSIIFSLLNV